MVISHIDMGYLVTLLTPSTPLNMCRVIARVFQRSSTLNCLFTSKYTYPTHP